MLAYPESFHDLFCLDLAGNSEGFLAFDGLTEILLLICRNNIGLAAKTQRRRLT